MLLTVAGLHGARIVAERLRQSLSANACRFGTAKIVVTASIGIATAGPRRYITSRDRTRRPGHVPCQTRRPEPGRDCPVQSLLGPSPVCWPA